MDAPKVKDKPKHFDEHGVMLPDIKAACERQFKDHLELIEKRRGYRFTSAQGYAVVDDQVYRVSLGTPARALRLRASKLGLSGRQFIKVRKAARKRVKARARATPAS